MEQMKACEHWIEKISADVDGELSLPERKCLADHLAGCAGCRTLREAFLRDRVRFVSAFDAATAEVSLTARVLDRLPSPPLRSRLRDRLAKLLSQQPAWSWAGAGVTMILLGLLVATQFRPRGGPAPWDQDKSLPAAEAMAAKSRPPGQTSIPRRTAPSTVSEKGPRLPSSKPIYQAELHLRVADAQTALLEGERLVEENGGVITKSRFPLAEPTVALLSCRVPPARFRSLLRDLNGLGTVLSRTVWAPSSPSPPGERTAEPHPGKATERPLPSPETSGASIEVFFRESSSSAGRTLRGGFRDQSSTSNR